MPEHFVERFSSFIGPNQIRVKKDRWGNDVVIHKPHASLHARFIKWATPERVTVSKDKWGNEVIKHRPRPYREEIGQGHEHLAYRSTTSGHILKHPRLVNTIVLRTIFQGGVDTIRQEFLNAQQRIDGTTIRIPKTHVLPSPVHGYVIGQEFIPNDPDTDIRNTLMQEGAKYLVKRYDASPDNFAYFQNTVYWFDPTRGRFNRVFDGAQRVFSKTGIGRKLSTSSQQP